MTDFMGWAEGFASVLPATPDDSDYVSLSDIVITGVEVPWTHFRVTRYRPDDPDDWATLEAEEDAGEYPPVRLTEPVMREAVARWFTHLYENGWGIGRIMGLLEDMDADMADAVLQMALYKEVIYS